MRKAVELHSLLAKWLRSSKFNNTLKVDQNAALNPKDVHWFVWFCVGGWPLWALLRFEEDKLVGVNSKHFRLLASDPNFFKDLSDWLELKIAHCTNLKQRLRV